MNLLAQCVYTIVEKNRLWEASREQAPSEPITERKRWVAGNRLLEQAKEAGSEVALVLADAADCTEIIAWALLDSVEVHEKTSEFRFRNLRPVEGHTPQELVLVSTGETIAPGFIRPYAICQTPDFLGEEADQERPEMLADEIIGLEGEVRESLIRHRSREQRLRHAKIQSVLIETGQLRCEVPGCGFDFFAVYGAPGREFAHVHHRARLSDRTEASATRLADLAIVCANCHAIIHRGGKCRPLKGLVQRRAARG